MVPPAPAIPMAPRPPLGGHLPELRRHRVAFCERLRAEYGNTVGFRAGALRVIVSSEPADVHTVLVDRSYDFHKAPTYRFLGVLLGAGLLTSEDDLHKRQRRLIAPFFTPRQIAAYADTFVACAEPLSWRDGQVVDLVQIMSDLTLEVVNRTLFGSDLDTDARDLGAAFLVVNRWMADEAYRWVHLPVWFPLPRHLRFQAARRVIEGSLRRLVAKRRARAVPGDDLLSTLLAARAEDGGSMSDAQLRDETLTLMFAGHETTALALAWAFYLLARHPEARRRLEEEVDGVLEGRPPGLADLARLPYTLQVLKETMRLYPPAPLIGRKAQRDVTLSRCTVAAGSVVACNIYGIHRRADLYPEPERFLPERFAPDRELPAGAYLPFALGPRICIGNHFALMEAHLLLARLAQRARFDLLDAAPVGTRPMITLHPSRPLLARVAPRAAA
jgi:cytochrome P450